MIVASLHVIAASVLLASAGLACFNTLLNWRTAQVNKETAKVNTEIQTTLMKLVDDNLAHEKERQKWIGIFLEEKAE